MICQYVKHHQMTIVWLEMWRFVTRIELTNLNYIIYIIPHTNAFRSPTNAALIICYLCIDLYYVVSE